MDKNLVGKEVTLRNTLTGIPKGTTGIIVDEYGTHVVVKWDRTLGKTTTFDKHTEIGYIDIHR